MNRHGVTTSLTYTLRLDNPRIAGLEGDNGTPAQTRTGNQRLSRRLLFHLSYGGIRGGPGCRKHSRASPHLLRRVSPSVVRKLERGRSHFGRRLVVS